MFEALNNLIENEVRELKLDFYSVIIGRTTSKGARSPKLWNKVYEREKKRIRMIPLDVKDENFEIVFKYLKEDKHCLGGAVAVPYKEKLCSLIKDNLQKEIKNIGAVNCFYRPTSDHLMKKRFTGTNTDGEAALEPITEYLKKNENLSICLLGFGGAGKAILAFLFKDYEKKHRIHLFNRSPVSIKDTNTARVSAYSLNEIDTYLPHFDLVINATSVGHAENAQATPVPIKLLKKAKKTILVYDIIYDPIKTTLLKNSEELGLWNINGLRMNLIQAVLAYSYTNKTKLSLDEIYSIMG